MQNHLAVTPLAGSLHQRVQHLAAQAGTAHLFLHRHATNATDAGLVLKQPPRRQGLAHAVHSHRVDGGGIVLIPLHVGRHFLLLHKYLLAQRTGQFLQVVPAADMHVHHGVAAFISFEQVTQGGGNGLRLFGHRVGIHVHQLTGDQQLIAPENRADKSHGRIANAVATHAHVQKIVHLCAGVVFNAGFLDVQIAAQRVHGFGIRHGQRTPVVGHSGVEVHQVVAVEHDLLHVHLDPAHAQAMRKTEVLSFHEVQLSKACFRARPASACSRRASGKARPMVAKP